MNVKDTLAAIRALGLSCSHTDGEFRINYKSTDLRWRPRHLRAYFTHGAEDALATAQKMALWQESSEPLPETPAQLSDSDLCKAFREAAGQLCSLWDELDRRSRIKSRVNLGNTEIFCDNITLTAWVETKVDL